MLFHPDLMISAVWAGRTASLARYARSTPAAN
jgi:hypothetical protein